MIAVNVKFANGGTAELFYQDSMSDKLTEMLVGLIRTGAKAEVSQPFTDPPVKVVQHVKECVRSCPACNMIAQSGQSGRPRP